MTDNPDAESVQAKKQKSTEDSMHKVDEKLLKPLKFANFIVNHPCILCWIMLIILVVIIIIDGLVFELSTTNSREGDRTFYVESHPDVERYDALNLALEELTSSSESDDAVTAQTEQQGWWTMIFLFKLDSYENDYDSNDGSDSDYWILNAENIQTIIEYENLVWESDDWRNKYCYYEKENYPRNFTCAGAIFSLARKLYDSLDMDTVTTAEIKDEAMSYINDSVVGPYYESLFNPGVLQTGEAYLYRSYYLAGLPIGDGDIVVNTTTNKTIISHNSKYRNIHHQYGAQEAAYIEWADKLWLDITVDNDAALVDGNLKVVVITWVVYGEYFTIILSEGMNYVIFSVLSVLVYMSFHLQSLFLSVFALLEILLSFPLAYFVYRFIFQVTHYDILSLLIIFVLLGVGADGVFVFTDAWQQSTLFMPLSERVRVRTVEEKHRILIMRMTFSFRRASKAMFVTQLTTFFAFIATATSVVMPISAFGIWSASVIAMNYVLVITLYPSLLIIHHLYIKKWEDKIFRLCRCACCRKPPSKRLASIDNDNMKHMDIDDAKQANAAEPVISASEALEKKEDEANAATVDGDAGSNEHEPVPETEMTRQFSRPRDAKEYRCFEKFLGTTWAEMIIRFRVCILLFFLILTAFAGWSTSTIAPQVERQKMFHDDHYMQISTDFASEFSDGEEDGLQPVSIVWGIHGINREGSTRWDIGDYGKVVWDKTFDMSSGAAQLYLRSICTDLKSHPLAYSSDNVVCITDYLEQYINHTLNTSFPWMYLSDADADYDSGTQSTRFTQMMTAFANSSYGVAASEDGLFFVGTDKRGDDVLRFVRSYALSTVGYGTEMADFPVVNKGWKDYIKEIKSAENGCVDYVCNPYQTSEMWTWPPSEAAFVISAVQGILIAMPLAFIILLLSTKNWIVSLFAVLDIIGIMLCELAVIAVQGWRFGVSESLAIVIIIGFSVDYVVHLANAYLESTAKTRHMRLGFALLTIGISVVSGAFTTFIAGLFLIFPVFIFFQKMGILMMTTVVASILWAMAFFCAMLAQFGPQFDQGSIQPCLDAICNRFVKCKDALSQYSNRYNLVSSAQ